MNKNYLLYIGVFLAGAVITPLYLSLFNDNDGDPAEAASEELLFEETETTTATDSGSRSNQVFVPMDSQEVIENDYAISPEVRIPTSLPQYAANQPSIPGYPNYGAIPPVALSFPEQKSTLKTSPQKSSASEDQAIAPKINTSAPILGNFTKDLSDNIFIPPNTRPDPNAQAPEPFETEAIAPNSVDLNNFLENDTSSDNCKPTNTNNPFRPNTCS
ncbi:hypothetical protein Lepto7376_4438 [[Leptolyngbya] sp. PCC 7376]|uniref:hypothetical protein n=1 Tax=[Leptolyngbya] sp. PCC 7376 TaxID=111781 RepID=UPI00029F22E5|nr:hypothetical protein [[Leptolyngbya] sp. PCC 7376]AFY40541.1 hypothetical protein Lepto7376_4438 [[Leptolyngbya] sp. PCC 7376]